MSGWGFQRTVRSQPTDIEKSARGVSIKDTPANKVSAVMEELSHDVHKFGRRVHNIQQFTKDIGTTRDNDKLRSKLKAERQHAAKINERIQKNISKLSRNLFDTQLQNSPNKGSDMLDSSSLSHRRQQLKKLKTQVQDMEQQYNAALKESLAKEKKHGKRSNLDDDEQNEEGIYGDDSRQNDDSDDDDSNPNSTKSIVREQMRQMNNQPKKNTHQQQLDDQIKLVLSTNDKSTIDVETMIAQETYREVKELQDSYNELHECFKDLNTIISEQDPAFDVILENVTQANQNVEMGVEEIKVAKSMTAIGGIQKLTSKLSIFKKIM
ncbi:hypothetical protein AKO1_014332 [Acrasis kona]|uniref:t-SNARE coiled-coil homology domain-containing protein n=1 Tax=Acrasis kona TaxID=1008807 RepID=A0AAW2Z119_9EUKA